MWSDKNFKVKNGSSQSEHIDKIRDELTSLIELKKIENQNPHIRALAYRIYESNGVVKREEIKNFIVKLEQNDRKILRSKGVKFGRYHIFLFKLFKPKAVSLRTLLWKNFNQKFLKLDPPQFGLNFVYRGKELNRDFMLMCGFEKFDSYYVRIDILERLFLLIFNSEKDYKKEIKVIPEMLNLLGCSKENFNKLLKKMNYKIYEKENQFYIKYIPLKKKIFIKNDKKDYSNNPFSVLNQLNLK